MAQSVSRMSFCMTRKRLSRRDEDTEPNFGSGVATSMSQSADNETLRFYQHEAEAYCQRTEAISSPALPGFLERLKPGASILELGCGSGRDTVEMLRLGYDVTPTDGSP